MHGQQVVREMKMLERLMLVRLVMGCASALSSMENETSNAGARAGFTGSRSAVTVLFGYFVMVLGLFAVCLMLLGMIALINAF